MERTGWSESDYARVEDVVAVTLAFVRGIELRDVGGLLGLKGVVPLGPRHDRRLPGRRVSNSSLRAWMPQQPAPHQPRLPAKKPVAATAP